MENQHQHIDTASDLRDLIAQTPEETEPTAPRKFSEPLVVIDGEVFREMRVALKMYRMEIKSLTSYRQEYKDTILKELDEVLSKTEWSNVKRIFWKLHPASAGFHSFPIWAPQTRKLSPEPCEEKDFWFFIWLFHPKV